MPCFFFLVVVILIVIVAVRILGGIVFVALGVLVKVFVINDFIIIFGREREQRVHRHTS